MTLDRDHVAQVLSAYDVGDELGRGAWGVVLRATHRQLNRLVAVKELPRAFAADPDVRWRFVNEARLLATFDHPHIVPIYDFVESNGLCLLVMELLEGGTLWDRFTRNGVTREDACSIVIAACTALQYAHDKGVLHRDIKPENLLFGSSGQLKVSDFGIAKVVGGAASMATRTGEVLGTPAYMAPEQAMGALLTPATDVYALGLVLYELLGGRLPFHDDGNTMALLYRHVHEQPVDLASIAPDLPADLARATMRALAPRPEDRYASAEELGVTLADAAWTGFGASWLERSSVAIMATGRIGAHISGLHHRAAPAAAPSGAPPQPSAAPPQPPAVRAPAPATIIDANPAGRSVTAAAGAATESFDALSTFLVPPSQLVSELGTPAARPSGRTAPSGPGGPGRPAPAPPPAGPQRAGVRRRWPIALAVLCLLAVAVAAGLVAALAIR